MTNKEKKLIARISNRMGNQMFVYATSFAIAKKLNRNLFLDIKSGLNSLNKKNKEKIYKRFIPKYELSIFNLSAKLACPDLCFDSFYRNFLRKIFKLLDNFKIKKKFIVEKTDINKKTFFQNNLFKGNFENDAYLEGYFECEKYFSAYRKDLIKEFSLKEVVSCNKYYLTKILTTNSVSVAIRADRYSETLQDDYDNNKSLKSNNFETLQITYINKAINFFKYKISNPIFFVFSDNPEKFSNVFDKVENIIFINKYISNKIIEDYYLMLNCKHFIVAPSTFHFWPAWLSSYHSKICTRPLNINVSNNHDYWPESWIPI